MRNSSMVFAIVSIAIGGCEVGPDYKPPQVTVNSSWNEKAQTRPSEDAASTRPDNLNNWWTNFNDPELNSLIQRSFKSNYDIQNAESRVLQARAQRGVVGSELFPVVNVDGGYQRAHGSKNVVIPLGAFGVPSAGAGAATPAITPAAAPARISPADVPAAQPGGPQSPLGNGGFPGVDTELYQAGFDASWELDVFGGQRRSIEAANADTAAAIEDRHDVQITLAAEIARNYIELRAAQRQSQIAADNLKSQQDTLDLTRSRRMAGMATDLDVAREATQVATTAATLPALESTQRQLIHELSILLAEDPSSLSDELSASAPIPPAPGELPLGVPADLMKRRPDIRRAERQLAAATARIGVATADLWPKFSITGSFGLDSTKFKQLPDWNSHYFAISPGVSWPIFDAGRIKSNIEIQKYLAKQADANYQETVLGALRDVEDAIANYRTEQERRGALADAVSAAQTAVELAEDQYRQGVGDFLIVLDAQRTLLQTQDDLTQSDSAISTDLVALYKALGGGWQVTVQ